MADDMLLEDIFSKPLVSDGIWADAPLVKDNGGDWQPVANYSPDQPRDKSGKWTRVASSLVDIAKHRDLVRALKRRMDTKYHELAILKGQGRSVEDRLVQGAREARQEYRKGLRKLRRMSGDKQMLPSGKYTKDYEDTLEGMGTILGLTEKDNENEIYKVSYKNEEATQFYNQVTEQAAKLGFYRLENIPSAGYPHDYLYEHPEGHQLVLRRAGTGHTASRLYFVKPQHREGFAVSREARNATVKALEGRAGWGNLEVSSEMAEDAAKVGNHERAAALHEGIANGLKSAAKYSQMRGVVEDAAAAHMIASDYHKEKSGTLNQWTPVANYDPNQPRDELGRWTDEGGADKQLPGDVSDPARAAEERINELRRITRTKLGGVLYGKGQRLTREEVTSRLAKSSLGQKFGHQGHIQEMMNILDEVGDKDEEVHEDGMPKPERMRTMWVGGVKFQWSEASKEQAAGTLAHVFTKGLPERLWAANRRVIFSGQEYYDDNHWASLGYDTEGFKTGATGGYGDIVVYNTSLPLATFAHESGHNLATQLWGDQTPPESSLYGKAQQAEGPITPYARHNAAEDFAEACAAYTNRHWRLKKEAFRQRFPLKYAAIADLLGEEQGLVSNYSPDQPRDRSGKWTKVGGSSMVKEKVSRPGKLPKQELQGILEALEDDSDDAVSWNALADLAEESGLQVYGKRGGVYHRVGLIQAVYADLATTSEGRSRIEDTQFYRHYAEPGYTDPGEGGFIALGNWNKITRYRDGSHETLDTSPEKFGDMLEKMGGELEWSDEWTSCDNCNGIVRTQPNSYVWHPAYEYSDGGIQCHTCHNPDHEED